MKKIKIAVGVSGGGRSLNNLILNQPTEFYEIALVVSSSPSAKANQIAIDHHIPLMVLDFSRSQPKLTSTSKTLYERLMTEKIDLVVLAGFLKLWPMDRHWDGKIINIHPALLPKFGGRGMHGIHVHEAVIKAAEVTTGATVHYVTEHYDEGRIISQIKTTVHSSDTAETLAARVFESECLLLPWTISKLADGVQTSEQILNYSGNKD